MNMLYRYSGNCRSNWEYNNEAKNLIVSKGRACINSAGNHRLPGFTLMKAKTPYITAPVYKPLRELDLSDDYLFGKVMRDKDILVSVLELILGFKIKEIVYINPQQSFEGTYDSKGIRLDIYADDTEGSRYAVEMQNYREYNIFKRSRYYHSVMDVDELAKGSDYNGLKKNYVIFICTYDPFGEGLHYYSFCSKCLQRPDMVCGDDTETVILSTKGSENDVSRELMDFLKFSENSTAEMAKEIDNELIYRIEKKICIVKNDPKLEVEYLTLLENYKREYENGLEVGHKIGFTEGEEFGIIKGEEKANRNAAERMIATGRYEVQEIADILEKTADEIESIQRSMKV